MNIIIAGDGKVGSTLTRQLVAEGHDITLIDAKAEVLEVSEERYDIMAVQGNCAIRNTRIRFIRCGICLDCPWWSIRRGRRPSRWSG